MCENAPLNIYLEDDLRQSAQAGQHNFINLIKKTVEKSQFRVEFLDFPANPSAPDVYSLSHMAPPPNAKGLVFRRVYEYPFWQIEATAERWHWDVARAVFQPEHASPDAARFYRFWQQRLYGDAALNSKREGYVYLPLQGRLDRKRSFQSCAPFEMIEHCLRYDKTRQIIATLHPKEDYSTLEMAHLEMLERKHPRLSIRTGEMVQHLNACDYIVTQNSSAAFAGYFFGKPALLFGEIDFHHIAVKADLRRLDDSFAAVATHSPPYDKYIWWFWQDQSINAGRDDASDRIAARLRRFGWPIK